MLKCLVLLLVFAIGGHAWGAPKPDKKTGDSDRAAQNTQPDKRGTQESPLVVTARSIHSDEETAEEARQEAEQKHFNRWTIGLTLAIAICAFLQFCAIVGQIFVYKGQSKMMASGLRLGLRNARAAQKSAEAAQESADAAKISALASMGVSVPTLMLYRFSCSPRGFADVKATLQSPMIEIEFKNYGQSPAFLKSYSVVITCEELPDDPAYDPINFPAERVVDSGREFALGDGSLGIFNMNTEDVEALFNRTKYLTIYGYVRYGDVFGSPPRDLKFCKRLVSFDPIRWNPAFLDWHSPKYTGQEPQWNL
jgi:hypothetical protein